MMFERFTSEARAAVVGAVRAAEETGTKWIDRRHLLVGLAGAGEPTLAGGPVDRDDLMAALRAHPDAMADADALRAVGIDVDAIRQAVDRQFGEGAWDAAEPPRKASGILGRLLPAQHPFTSEAKKTLELALREALADHAKELTATHVLRGLLRDPGPEVTAMIETKLSVADLRALAAPGSSAA